MPSSSMNALRLLGFLSEGHSETLCDETSKGGCSGNLLEPLQAQLQAHQNYDGDI